MIQMGDLAERFCYAQEMERYFFDLRECGSIYADEEGVELADVREARDRAILAARDVMCGEVRAGRLCLACSIGVRDAAGQQVLVLPFSEAVAVTGQC